jgi:hypothetical protein
LAPDASAGTAREVGSGGQTDGQRGSSSGSSGHCSVGQHRCSPWGQALAASACASSKINRSHGISHPSPASTGLQLRRTPHSFARLGRPSGHAKSGVNTSKPTPIWASNEVSTSFSAHQGPRPSGHGFISRLSNKNRSYTDATAPSTQQSNEQRALTSSPANQKVNNVHKDHCRTTY